MTMLVAATVASMMYSEQVWLGSRHIAPHSLVPSGHEPQHTGPIPLASISSPLEESSHSHTG